ncbi:G2/mitotic-specific cyclin S13-7-like isoform X1 [Prosopis cineraria]|uniref:G2/mitotic-specific cyclin S13-7-like isoform X1 n=1 Tax=Prosopis cineraria TaxID=364024 RepID=UPI00240EF3D4|nr:G2/mitotic-specific cyclin S13-7-like isoform X1 [Prosopis cineraria]
MATGAYLPNELQRGENKPKNVAAEGRNRRVLQDIGNLVYVSKRITRQEADKNKKPSFATTKILAAGKTVHPEEREVIIISSDEESEEGKEKEKEKEPGKARNTRQHSAKKNVKTLSAILSARSKAACGRTYKQKDHVVDVDAADIDNELAAVEYIDELYKFYKFAEDDSRVHDYLGSQPDVNAKMRAILVDWLIEVHRKFELMPETLHLTINIVDRFLSMKVVSRKELQLVGISSMLLACKYEEIWAPEVNDFVCISDNAYKREQILVMEKTILRKLEWYLTVPTPYVFLVRYIKASSPTDKEMENMAHFLAELSLIHYATVMLYSPSVVAASAVYAARCTLDRSPFWTETLKHYTGFSEDQLRECAKLMVSFHSLAGESKLKAVYKKFCNPDRCAVALLPPARSLLIPHEQI